MNTFRMIISDFNNAIIQLENTNNNQEYIFNIHVEKSMSFI